MRKSNSAALRYHNAIIGSLVALRTQVTDPTNPRNEFELSTDGFECNMVLEDLQHESPFGSSQATNPPFAVALTRDSDAVTLICCWRGSTTMEESRAA